MFLDESEKLKKTDTAVRAKAHGHAETSRIKRNKLAGCEHLCTVMCLSLRNLQPVDSDHLDVFAKHSG